MILIALISIIIILSISSFTIERLLKKIIEQNQEMIALLRKKGEDE